MDKLVVKIKVTDDISPGHDVFAVVADDREEMTRVNFGTADGALDYARYLLTGKPLERAVRRSTRKKRAPAITQRPLGPTTAQVLGLLQKSQPTTAVEIADTVKRPHKDVAANLCFLEHRGLARADRTAKPPYKWYRTDKTLPSYAGERK